MKILKTRPYRTAKFDNFKDISTATKHLIKNNEHNWNIRSYNLRVGKIRYYLNLFIITGLVVCYGFFS